MTAEAAGAVPVVHTIPEPSRENLGSGMVHAPLNFADVMGIWYTFCVQRTEPGGSSPPVGTSYGG